uniref:N-acetyltransferase domain-containing protein n=1 Tax=Chromera velia CCMP2878 TaxID=1169474 RepID=A0A0G4HDJ1_9ALVE|eukprot:Cvel_6443.t1-p1 / transcript=Cvel_6443.t1 / gene=Cvel_6443 / organism=Chromera_velia_CCMP2878 / gene_product=Alpha-tubulin N-acetyltransferase, putative / transcript_product=Alpha-tubulin N-acetyltransferase, putative / location=Cvel_scaffold315:66629-70598(-) / protein_length=277 / sequence_SO=supercontig / SO=protein_coding / is_pseudo=false
MEVKGKGCGLGCVWRDAGGVCMLEGFAFRFFEVCVSQRVGCAQSEVRGKCEGESVVKVMLRYEGTLPELIAYDRPSPKLLGFLRKHCGLSFPVPQSNNFVLFEKFFSVPRGTQTAAAQESARICSLFGEGFGESLRSSSADGARSSGPGWWCRRPHGGDSTFVGRQAAALAGDVVVLTGETAHFVGRQAAALARDVVVLTGETAHSSGVRQPTWLVMSLSSQGRQHISSIDLQQSQRQQQQQLTVHAQGSTSTFKKYCHQCAFFPPGACPRCTQARS